MFISLGGVYGRNMRFTIDFLIAVTHAMTGLAVLILKRLPSLLSNPTMPSYMQPLSTFPSDPCKDINAVLCDMDDTLTLDGQLPAASYSALENLQQNGFKVVVGSQQTL